VVATTTEVVLTGYRPQLIVLMKESIYSIGVNISNTSNDILFIYVPKLDMFGSNWTIFVLCFWTVVQGKGL